MTSLLLAADGHYYRDANGNVFVDAVFNYDFYSRYLEVFDEVIALGRITRVKSAPVGKKRADGPNVKFIDLMPGHGVKGLLKSGLSNKKVIKAAVHSADCVIARVSGVVGNMTAAECRRQRKPYSIEVVVDPWEYFAPGANGGLAAPVVRRLWTAQLKKDCKTAIGTSYVTKEYLQKLYPCRAIQGDSGTFTSHYSSVDLPEESFREPKHWTKKIEKLEIVHVANSFQGNGKGHLTLFQACKILSDKGIPFHLTCVGDGPSMNDYEKIVFELGIADDVTFTGRLSDGKTVRQIVHKADIFVFPTRAEGLPRVLLESMAEGTPCLSTPVCGIPEILPKECLFEPNDAEGFAAKLVELKDDPSALTLLSKNGLITAKEYSKSILQKRRNNFYLKVKESGRTLE